MLAVRLPQPQDQSRQHQGAAAVSSLLLLETPGKQQLINTGVMVRQVQVQVHWQQVAARPMHPRSPLQQQQQRQQRHHLSTVLGDHATTHTGCQTTQTSDRNRPSSSSNNSSSVMQTRPCQLVLPLMALTPTHSLMQLPWATQLQLPWATQLQLQQPQAQEQLLICSQQQWPAQCQQEQGLPH